MSLEMNYQQVGIEYMLLLIIPKVIGSSNYNICSLEDPAH